MAQAPAAGDLLVNCTSVGLEPEDAEGGPGGLGLAGIAPPAAVVGSGLRRRATPVQRWAHAGGARFVDGKEILVRQGALSLELWTGATAPVQTMRAALR